MFPPSVTAQAADLRNSDALQYESSAPLIKYLEGKLDESYEKLATNFAKTREGGCCMDV